MHLEKRKVKDKIKYFLAHSYREGKKVHKLRKYLGQDLSSKKLDERKIIAEKLILEEIHKFDIIKDPLQISFSKEEISEIRALEKKIPLKISHLSEKDWKNFSKLFTYNTNAIEGSTINKREVNNLLSEDKWPDKSKEDIAETYGVAKAIRYVRTTKEHISLKLIKKIHKLVFQNSKNFAGKFRKKGEDVVILSADGTVVDEGAPYSRITHLLNSLVTWYHQNKKLYPGLVLAAMIHNQFENIHPFADGNGRVGRILLNNILLKHNLPPINIDLKNRSQYYFSIREYSKNNNLKPTLDLFMKEYNSLKKQLSKK